MILAWSFISGNSARALPCPVIRVLTLPKADFRLKIGAQVGWGLWLLAVSAVVLAIASATAAQQLSRVSGLTVSRFGGTPRRTDTDGQRSLPQGRSSPDGSVTTRELGRARPGPKTRARPTPAAVNCPSESAATTPLPPVPPLHRPTAGRRFNLGDLEVEVPGIWLQKIIGGDDNPFSRHSRRGIWVVAPIKVSNNSNSNSISDSPRSRGRRKTYSSTLVRRRRRVARDARSSISLNPGFSGYGLRLTTCRPPRSRLARLPWTCRADYGGPHVMVELDTSLKTTSCDVQPKQHSPTPTTRNPIK